MESAVCRGDLKHIESLIQSGVDVNERLRGEVSLLIQAIKEGYQGIALALLSAGADVHVKDEGERSALHWACCKGLEDVVEALLDRGSRMNERDWRGGTPLRLAIERNDLGICMRLLRAGANCDGLQEEQMNDLYQHAFDKSNLLAIETLLQNGYKLSRNEQEQLLHCACRQGNTFVVDAMIASGCNINFLDATGSTPLMVAVCEGHEEVVKKLILAGAKVGMQDAVGDTALHIAATHNHIHCGVLLAEAGASVRAKNKLSLTPLDLGQAEFKKAIKHALSFTIRKALCVIGNAEGGKSTLIAALQAESNSFLGKMFNRFRTVTDLRLRTAGIETVLHSSQRYGEVLFFDFAGQNAYHGPHQMFLESLCSKPTVSMTLLLVVKMTEEEEAIFHQLHCWLSPIALMSTTANPPCVIVIGSFLDKAKSKQEAAAKVTRCIEAFRKSIGEKLQLVFVGSCFLNCRQPQSEGIDQLCHFLQEIPIPEFRAAHTQYSLAWVLSQIRSSHLPQAVQLQEFSTWVQDNKDNLPRTMPLLEEVCWDLTAAGHALYLPNKEDPVKSWLVLDLPSILYNVYGTLFSQSEEIVNEFGVLHYQQLAKLFQGLDLEMVQQLLISLEFCIPVDPAVLKVELSKLTQSEETSGWLFFPALISAKPPKPTLSGFSQHDTHYFCWQLRSAREHSISARVMQTILLRLLAHFVVKHHNKVGRWHSCSIWWNGIAWQSFIGVEVAVNITNRVVQVIGATLTSADKSCQYLTDVIHDILLAVHRLSPKLAAAAYIVHPPKVAATAELMITPMSKELFPVEGIQMSIRDVEEVTLSLKDSQIPWTKIRVADLFGGYTPSLADIERINWTQPEPNQSQTSVEPSQPQSSAAVEPGQPEPCQTDVLLQAVYSFTESDCSTLYHKAIADNPTITLHIAKAMTIGPPQVGKTSLRHHLLGLPPPDFISSTPVIKTAETVNVSEALLNRRNSDMKDKASSDDSEDDVSECIAEKYSYASDTCVLTGGKWVVVNSDSGILSLLRFLQHEMDVAASQIQSSTAQFMDEPGPMVPETMALEVLPHTLSLEDEGCEALIELLGDTSLSVVEENLEGKHHATPIQPLNDISQPAMEDDSDSVATMIHRMYRELQNPGIANVVLPDAHLVQFIDCGGQLAYHDILPIFVNIPAIYLHVFNSTQELTHCPVDELCSAGGRRMYSAKSALSVAEMIKRSVMTVHSLAGKKTQLPPEVNCEGESPTPHIVLVGTHLDKLEQDEEDPAMKLMAINETLCETLKSKLYDLEGMVITNRKSHHMFFPVNNKLYVDKHHQSGKPCKCKHCRAVQLLRKKITKQAMQDAVKVKVPMRWYLRQLLELSQGAEKPLYSYSELYQHCKEEGSVTDIGEFHAMVTYFHALGLLVHLCGADVGHTEDSDCLVFTNPSYLFENISKLYQVQFEKGGTQCKIALKREGKLTSETLRDLNVDDFHLDHNHFMDILVQLFIGAEIRSEEGGRTLFVPSMLTNSENARPTRPQEQFLCLAVTFKDIFYVPCGVFTGVAARLLSVKWKICTHSISRVYMEFEVGALGTVILLDYATHIGVKMVCHEGLSCKEYQRYRDAVVKATADSYCFLFHSKTAKDPHSGTCRECRDSPYLVLGQTCQVCPDQPSATPKTPHFAELMVENDIPRSVRCHKTGAPKLLSALEQVAFQNISLYAVVKDQHTSSIQQQEVLNTHPPCYLPAQTAQHILDKFRRKFIREVDANFIVYELEHEGIISNGDRMTICQKNDVTQQNQALHACLKRTCNEGALFKVCDIIMDVKGNQRMNALGKEMKMELETEKLTELNQAWSSAELNQLQSSARQLQGARALLDISSTPDTRDVDELVVTPVAPNWQRLALRLGVEGCVSEVVLKNHPNDCEGACREMLKRWLRGERHTGEEERTWSTLLTVLGRAGFVDLERSLRRVHFKEE